MNPAAAAIAQRIRAAGPITVADFMAEALTHPVHGYYTTRDPLGAAGDFTTAPEISQMFGELLGLCLASAWMAQGAPSHVILAELGPGRGTLMEDALRATARVPGFRAAAAVHFVETSPALRQAQAARVPGAHWHDAVADLPEGPLYLIANEFFDALPIRQFQRDGGGWRERLVGFDGERLHPGLGDIAPVPALAHRLSDTRDGDIVEWCPALPAIVGDIGRRIAAQGGAAIIVDYGGWNSLGDTLQALAGHRPVDPFDTPGSADLTAHVDFAAIARAAAPARATAMVPQGVFLERLGITARAQALARDLTGAARDSHVAAHRRLTHPDEMGHLFRAMAIHPWTAPPPPGLET